MHLCEEEILLQTSYGFAKHNKVSTSSHAERWVKYEKARVMMVSYMTESKVSLPHELVRELDAP